LNWRLFAAVAVLAGLALGFAPAFSQAAPSSSGVASVSLLHNYMITPYGFGVLNDSFTFTNNGTSSVQIPTLQVGLPNKISARTTGLVLVPNNQFSLTQAQINGNTSVTITPDQPTLNPGGNITVALEGFVNNILNYTTSVGFTGVSPSLVMVSPSVNVNLTNFDSSLSVPSGAQFLTVPPNFGASSTGQDLTLAKTDTIASASEAYLTLNATSSVTPLRVTHLVRTIVPSANCTPMVEDEFTVHNYGNNTLGQVHLNLLAPGLESVTEIPSTSVPLVNPLTVTLSSGIVVFTSANIGGELLPNSNVTLTFAYPLPSSLIAVSGSSVTLTIPYKPLIGALVSNYSIILAPTKGIVPSGQTSFNDLTVTPLTPGDVKFTYTVSVGWAADQAIPAGILVFAVAFAMFAIQRPADAGEEGEKAMRKTSDVLRAFDEKTGLETQYMEEFASAPKGSISKAEFDRMRNEVSELRSRAIQRLNEMKQVLGSGRQYDVLTRVAEAEKEEDRAFRDLLNLYMQYHGNRMNEETFKRLQPNYRKRVDAAINRLSDLLHETKTEEK
jgi:hypothetical protein